jgi:hypothetical protein
MSRKAACVMRSKRQAVPPNLVRPFQNVKNFVPGDRHAAAAGRDYLRLEPWSAPVRPERLPKPRRTRSPELEVTNAEKDCSEGPGAP